MTSPSPPETRLHHDRDPQAAAHYSHVRTLAEKYAVPSRLIEPIQNRYAAAYNRSGLHVTRKDEIEGIRRAVLMDPLWFPNVGAFTLLVVGEDGLLSSSVFPEDQFGGRYPSVMELLTTEPGERSARLSPSGLELNRFASSYRYVPLSVLHALSTGVVFSDQHEAQPVDPFTDEIAYDGLKDETEAKEQVRKSLHRLSATLRSMGRHRLVNSHGLACHAIMDALDYEIARIMRSSQCTSTADALWLSGKDRHGHQADPAEDTAKLSLYRRQACRTYPSLTSFMSEHRMFNAQIDAGKPLAPAIAEQLALTDREVRTLNGLSWQKIQMRPQLSIDTIKMVAKTGPYLSKFNRRSFGHGDGIAMMSDRLGLEPRDVIEKVSGLLSGKGPDVTRSVNRVVDSIDMLQYVVRHLHIPAAMIALKRREKPASDQALSGLPQARVLPVAMEPHTGDLEREIACELFSKFGLKDLLAGSDRWHRTLPAHQERIGQFRDDTSWEALLPPQDLGGGITARELTSSDELTRQGRKEQHCVGGYSASVTSSRPENFTQIWSIEHYGGIIGTLELRGRLERASDDKVRVVCSAAQLRGFRNSGVDPACTAAAEAVLRRVEGAGSAAVHSWIHCVNRAGQKQSSMRAIPQYIKNAGYNVWEEGRFEKAWNELSVYLPRTVRKAGPEALIASMEGRLEMPDQQVRVSDPERRNRLDFICRSGGTFVMKVPEDPTDVETEAAKAIRDHPMGITAFWDMAEAQIEASIAGRSMRTTQNWQLREPLAAHIYGHVETLRVADPDTIPTRIEPAIQTTIGEPEHEEPVPF